MYNWPTKLSSELLDYKVEWKARLKSEQIVTSTFTVISGDVTISSLGHTETSATVWLTGGSRYSVLRNVITTTGNRTMVTDVFIIVKVK